MRSCLHSPIAAFSNSRYPRLRYLFLVVAALLTGSVIAPALAFAEVRAPDLDRWAEHPAVQRLHVSDEELPPNLFLVRTSGRLSETDGIVVHGASDGVFLVSGDTAALRALSQRGCTVIPLRDVPAASPPVAREWVWVDAPDPAVEAMVDQVRWGGVREKIQWLVGFRTRYSLAPNHHAVAVSIRKVFESYGLQAALWPFEYRNMPMWNVVANQTGTKYPDSYVIICGHFDSTSDYPMFMAPGADDNATGTAAVLTAAEILSRYTFEHSIRYICFAGEEQILQGSYNYALWAYRNNLDIVGVLNFDMLGYWEPGVEKDLEIETNQASKWLANAVINAANLYTGATYELHVYDNAWWGDHWYFWRTGYAAVNHEEAWDWIDPDFNPYYHTRNDLLEHLDPGFTVGNIRIGVASLATLAVHVPPLKVSFDIRPGSCRNPLNPNSRGIVPAIVLGSEDLDVNEIDVGSLRIEGKVSPSATRVVDMGTAGSGGSHPCADMSPDGIDDLRLEVSTEEIADVMIAFGKGNIAPLHLTGRLVNGTHIEGEDAVVIVGGQNGAPLFLAAEPPITFELHQNVPNPFNPATSITFDVPHVSGAVTLCIYDVSGRLVRTLVNGALEAGRKTVVWDGLNEADAPVAAGVYFYRLTAPGFERTRKMMLLR